MNLQTAFLSPPVAMSAYYLKNVMPQWGLGTIYSGMAQFMVIQVVAWSCCCCSPSSCSGSPAGCLITAWGAPIWPPKPPGRRSLPRAPARGPDSFRGLTRLAGRAYDPPHHTVLSETTEAVHEHRREFLTASLAATGAAALAPRLGRRPAQAKR